MAKPHRLSELERQLSEPLDTLIPRVVNAKASQKAAAKELGLAESTVSDWLRKNGYRAVTQWVKCSTGTGAA